jgi:hypothetical protein
MRCAAAFALVLLPACGGGGGSPSGPSATPAPPEIGPGGGSVSSATARLQVPAGALASPVALALRPATNVPLDPYAVLGAVVEVAPAGTSFASPATLAVGFASGRPPIGADPGEFRLHVLDAGAWRELPGGSVDRGASEAAAPIGAAGVYGVVWVPGPSASCGSDSHQFDFWVGEWNLVVPNGVAGPNDITRHGCVLEEHFREASGSVGRSVSFASGGRWVQTYIDSRGTRLPLEGQLEGRDMVLYVSGGNGRSTWRPEADGRVRFLQEQMTAGAWTVTFDSFYVRR